MPTHVDAKVTFAEFNDAAKRNDLSVLDRYVAEGGDIDFCEMNQPSALVTAMQAGSVQFALALLRRSPDVGAQWTNSALRAAIETGNAYLINGVFEEMTYQGRVLSNPEVVSAVKDGDDAAVRRYIRQGRPVTGLIGQQCLLGYAAEARQHVVMRLLLEAGADPNPADVGEKLMCQVAARGDVQAAEILLAYGDPKDLLANSGAKANKYVMAAASPLHKAAARRHPEMVAYLISKGANAAALDGKISAFIHLLNKFGRDENPGDGRKTLEILLDNLPSRALNDLYHEGIGSITLMQRAAAEGLEWALAALIDRGVPVDQVSEHGSDARTPFLIAVYHANLAAVDLLSQRGACVDKLSPEGDGALHVLAKGVEDGEASDSAAEVLVKLLTSGCDLDEVNSWGVSAREHLLDANENFREIVAAHDARAAMRSAANVARKAQQAM
jgi:ankyrin repeat protein